MYSEIASNNTEQIRRLLYMYKTIYRIVGIFVLTAGLLVSLFLPFILKDNTDSWGFIYTIYYLQLLSTLCTYFLAYRRILFVTYQKIYFCTMVDTAVTIISTFLKMAVLIWFKNYILYLLVATTANIAANLIIAWRSRISFPDILKIKVTKEDFKKLNLWYDVKNMMATKIAGTIYGSSDSIIMTMFLGVGAVGLVNNYQMISAKIQEFIISIFKALQASIGNMVYDKDKEKGIDFFYALDLLGFYMGLTAAVGMIVVGQDFIVFWLKDTGLLLSMAFLVLLSLNVFIAICNNPMNYFRNTLGHFESDRNYMIAAALVNVVLTLLFITPFGVAGVMIGTVAGHLLIFMGRTVVVYKHYVQKSALGYYGCFLIRMSLMILTALSTLFLVKPVDGGLIGILIKGIVSVITSSIVFLVYSIRRKEFKVILTYIKTVIKMLTNKSKNK